MLFIREVVYMVQVILAKIESIERCVNRVKEIYQQGTLEEYLYLDALILNLQRACQQSIDLAMYIVSEKGLGLPKFSREAFKILYENQIISEITCEKMTGIIGFRNIAIHEYQNLDINIIKSIVENDLGDFAAYIKEILKDIEDFQ